MGVLEGDDALCEEEVAVEAADEDVVGNGRFGRSAGKAKVILPRFREMDIDSYELHLRPPLFLLYHGSIQRCSTSCLYLARFFWSFNPNFLRLSLPSVYIITKPFSLSHVLESRFSSATFQSRTCSFFLFLLLLFYYVSFFWFTNR